MQNVPKIVRDRLKAAPPAVDHPDADLLTAFAERSLPEVERTVVLEHLANCGDCRDIVALALPAIEPVQQVVHASPGGWLTWPTLRWGFVAAGIVAIASVGIVQLQRHQSATSRLASKQSAPVEVAANEPKKEVAPFVAAAPTEQKEKLQSPAAPAFADSLDRDAMADKKSRTRDEASPTRILPPQAAPVVGRKAGATLGGPIAPGLTVANQLQQQNAAQNQAPALSTPPAFAKQAQANDISGAPAPTPKGQMSGAAPAKATENASSGARQTQPSPQLSAGANYGDAVGKAKAPVPLASHAEEVAGKQPKKDQMILRGMQQTASGQISGYVVDPTGAVVPNARITITPSKAGTATTVVTNAQGTWLVAGLPTGNYKAQAEAPGFKTSILNFNYDANQPSTYSFTLSPGSVSEVVEVSAQNAPVQTETASVGGAVAGNEVTQLPVNGRSVTQLAAVAPGVLPRWTISSTGRLQRSFDQGKTWQGVDVNAAPASSASLEMVARESRAIAADTKVFRRDLAGPTFRAVSALGSDVWAGGSGGALYHSLDAGGHWTRVVPSSAGSVLTGDIVAVEFSDPQHGKITTSTSEVWTTSDAGQTWQKQ